MKYVVLGIFLTIVLSAFIPKLIEYVLWGFSALLFIVMLIAAPREKTNYHRKKN